MARGQNLVVFDSRIQASGMIAAIGLNMGDSHGEESQQNRNQNAGMHFLIHVEHAELASYPLQVIS